MIEKTIKRDPEGRFERHGKALSKTQKKKKPDHKITNGLLEALDFAQSETINKQGNIPSTIGTGKRGPGRPKGSKNKTSLALKEAILAAADEAGGEDGLVGYLRVLAIENSSAFAGLLGKVLPSTLAMPESNDGQVKGISFERIIVWPDGHREIEGVTPKQLPAPQQTSIAHQPQVGENGSNEDEQS